MTGKPEEANDEARRISKLISRLPGRAGEGWNKARSRRKPRTLQFKPMTIGDLIKGGNFLEVHCGNCRPERHLHLAMPANAVCQSIA
jgi:hypothetical protein